MNFNLMSASTTGGVFCCFVLRSCLDLQHRIGSVDATVTDHVAIEIESVEIRADHDHQELASLRKRLVFVLGTKNMWFCFYHFILYFLWTKN